MNQSTIPNARESMSPVRVKLNSETPILEAIREMSQIGVVCAPVVDSQDLLLGLLTEKDCLRFVSLAGYDNNGDMPLVGDYMSASVPEVSPDMDLFRVAEIFVQNNFPSLPVIEESRLVGRLSRLDVLKAMESYLSSQEQARAEGLRQHEQVTRRPKGIADMQRSAASHSPSGLARIFSRNR